MNRRAFLSSTLGSVLAPVRSLAQTAAAKAKPLNLKITGLKTFVVNTGSLNWVFCKIYTNAGLVGLGEGSVTSKEATVAQAIMEHERFLVGKDPTDIESLWQSMYRFPRWRGGPILNSAISAVEIALWDILGQALGVPVYKLLGGAARSRIRMYLDVGSTPEDFLRAKELGYTAAKTTPLSPTKSLVQPSAMIRETVHKLQAIRKAVGDDFDIAVDAHGRCTTAMAIDSARAWKSFRCSSSRSRLSWKTSASWLCCGLKPRPTLQPGSDPLRSMGLRSSARAISSTTSSRTFATREESWK